MRDNKYLKDLIERYPQLISCIEDFTMAFELLCKVFERKNKLLIAGNGGSASDADHIAGELLKSFSIKQSVKNSSLNVVLAKHLQPALPAIPLANLTGIFTAFSNDCEYDWTFAQLVYGLGQAGDCLLAISTSGNSKNIINAVNVAKAQGMFVVGLSGVSGGNLKNLCDVCICVPETETFKIQELHLPIYHCLCLMLEEHFFNNAEK